ncbi:hypothetical protein PLICRDRAFT_37525 [Plicaturopsis crispa FD-325 SS-3]|nr:hypothetical protein PLICRDRAFT_37525 [Plicaturopsis crispa FD-325 SS-3]
MSSSASTTATGSAAASSSSAASGTVSAGSHLKVVGIILAIASGLLIGSSFVFKKKGLLRSQAGQVAGEGVAYLKSPLWWLGMTMMILGELCNFAAYAFIEALVVTPLGALSVVVCAILSSIFLQEKLTFFGWLGCALCIIGSVIIALNGPQEQTVGQITDFQKLFLSPGFLVYAGVLIAVSLSIVFYFGPKYGKKSMLWYIMVCSMIGGISVSVTTGLGAAIVTTASGDNQFKHWFIYFLIGFVAVTLITEVYYLNMALALFNTVMVTPTYYVIFTFFSMVTTVVLFQGLSASVTQIITVVMGFLVICLGITILQMSKVDPAHLSKLDRRSTMLLQAARNTTEVEEKSVTGVEDPGIDALRGSFGTVGSIIRARSARRISQSTNSRTGRSQDTERAPYSSDSALPSTDNFEGLRRHQLWDAPMPGSPGEIERISMRSQSSFASGSPGSRERRPTIKFGSQEVVHQYHRPGTGDNSATHEHRDVHHIPESNPYPPPPNHRSTTEGESTPRAEDMRKTASAPAPNDEVRSAPPVLNAQFFHPPSTDPFSTPSPSTVPASSFPSASDSIGSNSEAPWNIEERELAARKHNARYNKSYPKGEDDGEESVSLWRRSSMDGSEEDVAHGGVRLVPGPTSSGSRF